MIYKGEGKPYHNSYGATFIASADNEDQAKEKASSVFNDTLKSKGYEGVEFELEIFQISQDEAEHLIKNIKSNKNKLVN